MSTLNEIDAGAKQLADALSRVNAIATELDKAIEIIKRTELPKLRKWVAAAAEAEAALKAKVEAAPGLFVKPKTVTLHGIKCGYEKGKGSVQFANPERVCTLIYKHFPHAADTLIISTESPSKTELAKLTASDLKRLGCELTGTGDRVVVKPVDGAGVKMAQALLQGMTAEVA